MRLPGLDSTMFDSGQLSHSMLRAHCHNVIDEELNRPEHRNVQSGGEMKRKSGIHTVYFPSVPDAHHPPTMKQPSVSQKQATTSPVGITRFGSTTSSNMSPVASHSPLLSRVSPVQQQQQQQQQQPFPHFVPMLRAQRQLRFAPSQPSASPGLSVAPGSETISAAAGAYSCSGVRTQTAPLLTPAATMSALPANMLAPGNITASSPTFHTSPLVPGTVAAQSASSPMLPLTISTSVAVGNAKPANTTPLEVSGIL
ncbi:unnamed protein product [Gongylonema pulchrum]|uniref:Uncharacterized protein n=1 Tax=Gongylonema pulchrum TaxID=637853 RepID=A0A183D6P2_9BILA|nr:unnamed protein product [Gongylonema pulchrum]